MCGYKKRTQPVSELETGCFHHLVPGQKGFLNDPRQTPIEITEINLDTGFFTVAVLDFEDRGAHWSIPFENVSQYGFPATASHATPSVQKAIAFTVQRFDHPLVIEVSTERQAVTEQEISQRIPEARQWLRTEGQFLHTEKQLPDVHLRKGSPALIKDLQRFLEHHGLWELEERFSSTYVSNPRSGELIKGHGIVLAEMGLAPFHGKVVRDPNTFIHYPKPVRQHHILWRLAFLRALFAELNCPHLLVYRGIRVNDTASPHSPGTWISTALHPPVAMEHITHINPTQTGLMYSRWMPVDRLWMTFYETRAMNQHYLETEAVFLGPEKTVTFF